MTKKFAVCFSGYPRFVRTVFPNIKKNFLDGLGSYDIYANLQWDSENWKGSQIHHENKIKFETCLLYTSPSPRDATLSRMPSSA